MRRGPKSLATLAAVCGMCGLGACTVAPPRGPTVMALPPPGKSLPEFQHEDADCRNYAEATIGYTQPGQAGNTALLGSAGLGTLLGAAGGAAIGAIAGNAGAGTAIGAVTGLAGGSLVGANNAQASEFGLQQRYNMAYTQCMYSRGNSVQSPPPGYGGVFYPPPPPLYSGPVW
jgi:OmpA family protein